MLWLLLLGCPASEETDPIGSTTDTEVPSREWKQADCLYVEGDTHGEAGAVDIEVDIVAEGLATPWGIDWMPDGDLLLSERDGWISRVDGTTGQVTQLAEAPITSGGEGGLLGLAIHPEFAENRWFYIYYTVRSGGVATNKVERWVLSEDGTSAEADTVIVEDIEALLYHNGGRLRFGPDGYLYIGTGDATDPDLSQDLDSLAGKILRVDEAGNVPDDNPYPGNPVYLWGIRNTQGFDWVAGTDWMAVTDHGPSGLPAEDGRTDHDEVSIAPPGANLGWPDIYACETGEGYVTPSITFSWALPPGGAAFYTGNEIEEWQGDLLIGVMGFDDDAPHLHRLRFAESNDVEVSEVYLQSEYGRLREVIMGPDGGLYVTTSNCDGRGSCGDGDYILRIGR